MDTARDNLSQRTAQRLEELIRDDGEFGAGAKLPNENELAERFGVSRTTLREAIRALVAKGLLVVRRGKGTFAAESLEVRQGLDLSDMSRMRLEVKDLYEVRLMFEPQAAALACRRASDEELREIAELAKTVDGLVEAGLDETDADLAFHSAILRGAHNEFVMQMAPVVSKALSERSFLEKNRPSGSCVRIDHSLIMEFLLKRDALGTESALRLHLRRTMLD